MSLLMVDKDGWSRVGNLADAESDYSIIRRQIEDSVGETLTTPRE